METKERVLQWLTGSDTCFLIGAGCSRCAGKPLIGELTTKVLANVDASIKTEFDGLKGVGTRPPTIEDLINYLVRYQFILQTVHDGYFCPTPRKGQISLQDGFCARNQHIYIVFAL